jgi:hypothetical protein
MSALATLLFLGVGALPFASSERTLERELPVGVPLARIVHSFGECQVLATGEQEKPSAKLHLVASGADAAVEQRYLELTTLDVVVESGRLRVESHFPEKNQQPAGLSFAATLVVKLPASVALDLQNRYGGTLVERREAGVKVDSQFGPVEVRSVRGAVEVDEQWAAVTVVDAGGDVTVRGKSAAVTVERAAGVVDVRTHGGAVKVDGAASAHVENRLLSVELLHVSGDATVVATSSDVTAKEIGGSLTVDGANGATVVEGVGRELTIQQKFGKVDARRVKGSATVVGHFTDVTVADVGGDAQLSSPFAPVRATAIGGTLHAENSSRPLEIVDARGDVEANAHGGKLDVRWTKWPAPRSGREEVARAVTLTSENGGIEVALPDGAAVRLDATSSVGQLDCPLEGTTFAQSGAARTATLELGDAKSVRTKLHATCVGGAIRVRRAPAR